MRKQRIIFTVLTLLCAAGLLWTVPMVFARSSEFPPICTGDLELRMPGHEWVRWTSQTNWFKVSVTLIAALAASVGLATRRRPVRLTSAVLVLVAAGLGGWFVLSAAGPPLMWRVYCHRTGPALAPPRFEPLVEAIPLFRACDGWGIPFVAKRLSSADPEKAAAAAELLLRLYADSLVVHNPLDASYTKARSEIPLGAIEERLPEIEPSLARRCARWSRPLGEDLPGHLRDWIKQGPVPPERWFLAQECAEPFEFALGSLTLVPPSRSSLNFNYWAMSQRAAYLRLELLNKDPVRAAVAAILLAVVHHRWLDDDALASEIPAMQVRAVLSHLLENGHLNATEMDGLREGMREAIGFLGSGSAGAVERRDRREERWPTDPMGSDQ